MILFQKRRGLKIHILNEATNCSYCDLLHYENPFLKIEGDIDSATCISCIGLYEEKEYIEEMEQLGQRKKRDDYRWSTVAPDIREKILELEDEKDFDFTKRFIDNALRLALGIRKGDYTVLSKK